MKRAGTTIVFILLIFGSQLNAQGIKFCHKAFEQLLTQAEHQDKVVFIDFYTQWCAPCKSLSKFVFTDERVGDFFNQHFICAKMDAEVEGKELAKKYGINAYPTMLFLNEKGEVLQRVVGSIGVDDLLEHANKVVNSLDDPDNITAMKKLYPSKKEDETFLKKYIQKLEDMHEDPSEAIDDYLKVQTEIKENYFEMMEFILKNKKYMKCGGEAERIVNDNYDEYWEIATRNEERMLATLKKDMVMHTRQYALANNDVALYELFMQRWTEQNSQAKGLLDEAYWTLELLNMKGETKAYRKLAIQYLDELMSKQTVSALHAKDEANYKAVCKRLEGQASNFMTEGQKNRALNAYATQVSVVLLNVAQSYLEKCKSSKDYKATAPCIDYGKQLMPGDYRFVSYEADVLFARKQYEKAIALKEQALSMMDAGSKKKASIQSELVNMKEASK